MFVIIFYIGLIYNKGWMNMKRKILLYGISTYKNRGVEAIINSTLNQISSDKFDVSVASFDHTYNKQFYNDQVEKYIKHYRKSEELTNSEKDLEYKYQHMPFDYNNFELLYQGEVVKEIKKSDICVSVGGDNYCYDHCTWLYALDRKSKDLGKKTVLWGASLFEDINDMQLVDDMRNFDVLVIRESLSFNAIKKYIPLENILYQPDPAFSLETKKIELNRWYSNRKILAVNLSPLTIKNDDQYKAIIDFINYVLKNTKYSICLLPHVTTDDCNDLDILGKLADEFDEEDRVYLEKGNYNCCELKYIISKCQMLIAARTHASIAAYSTLIPTLVIGYSVKSRGIAKDLFGSYDDYVISSDKLSFENLIEKFNFIDSNKKQIRNTLEKVIPQMKEKSQNLFQKVLDRLDFLDKREICRKSLCIGCGVCEKQCPTGAITLVKEKDGFLYPKINLDKCIHCNKCRNCCSINQKYQASSTFGSECFAMKNKNVEERLKSTSGGVFSVLASAVLKKKGIVFGAMMDSDFSVRHVKIESILDLDMIRGSKYTQSSLTEIFEDLKVNLDNGNLVLFCGTPCQIGAVNTYLGKSYNNLITVSVICHGVMSNHIFQKYIKEIESRYEGKEIDCFNFRTKENKWTVSSIKYEIDNNSKIVPFTEDALMNLYLKNLILRESCYDCKFKGKNNQADLIIGDFWGIEVIDKNFFDQGGVSSVIVNSNKGKEFLIKYKIFDQVIFKKAKIKDIIKYNPSLISSVEKDVNRYQLMDLLDGNTISLISNYYNSLYQKYSIFSNELEEKNEKIVSLIEENTAISNKLVSILESRRWKLIDKVFNTVSKVRRK